MSKWAGLWLVVGVWLAVIGNAFGGPPQGEGRALLVAAETQKKPAKKQTLEEAKKTITEHFKQEQMQKLVRENIDKLRAAAKIEILIKDLPPEAPKPAAPTPGAAPAPAPAPAPQP